MIAPGRQVQDFWELFKPLPKQIQFLKLLRTARYVLFGGARGPGKSRTLRWALLWLLLEWYKQTGIRGVKVALFCETYPELRDRQVSKIELEFPKWLGTLKESKTDGLGFHLHEQFGGGVLLLRNLDDPSKYMSSEWAAIGVDELTKIVKETFDVLRGSLRWPGIEHTVFMGATNPGGIGHVWVKELWIDGTFPVEMEPLRKQFAFVPALPSDNPYLPDSYWEELNSLPEHLRRAWVEGSWDYFTGQAFDEWRRELHVRAFEPPDEWRPGGGLDWGYDSPGWFGLCYVGPEERQHWRWEFAFGNGTKNGKMLPYDVGYAIGKGLTPYRIPPYIVADSAMWADTFQGKAQVSDAQEVQRGLNDAFAGNFWTAPQLIPCSKGPESRAQRKTIMHAALRWKPGPDQKNPLAGMKKYDMPKLTVHTDCSELIRSLPLLVVDPDEPRKIAKGQNDHPYDGATYFMQTLTAGWWESRSDEPIDNRPEKVEGRHQGLAPASRLKLPGLDRDDDPGMVPQAPWTLDDSSDGSDLEGW